MRPQKLLVRWWPPLAITLLFCVTVSLFLSYPGIQNDEALFADPLYRPDAAIYRISRVGQCADSRRPAGRGDRGFVLLAFAGRTRVAGCVDFVLTTSFDWRPVVLLVAGLVALVQFHRTGGIGALALGWFCFGLGKWARRCLRGPWRGRPWRLASFSIGNFGNG
jgi:hypothetical protein